MSVAEGSRRSRWGKAAASGVLMVGGEGLGLRFVLGLRGREYLVVMREVG